MPRARSSRQPLPGGNGSVTRRSPFSTAFRRFCSSSSKSRRSTAAPRLAGRHVRRRSLADPGGRAVPAPLEGRSSTTSTARPRRSSTRHIGYAKRPMAVASSPIGRPIPNAQIYILNDALRPRRRSASPANMYIGGVGLARGYLNRPDVDRREIYSRTPSAPSPEHDCTRPAIWPAICPTGTSSSSAVPTTR